MIDADGCVRISGGCTQYVSITNRYLPVLGEIQERFGGNLRIDKNVYRYEITGEGARKVLREIYPFLREKKEQARLCLLFSDFPPRSRMRALIKKRVSDLKRICYIQEPLSE